MFNSLKTWKSALLTPAGRVQNTEMPLMKAKRTLAVAPSSIKAEGGKYHELPGAPVGSFSLN
jgi:hypothetical protein